MAGISNQAVAERKQGTIDSVQLALKRLCDLRSRLATINNTLHGPKPEDASKAAQAPGNLAAYVEHLHGVLDECESEVNATYQSLGIG